MRKWVVSRASLAVVLLTLLGAASPDARAGDAEAPADPLAALNDASRTAYRRAKDEVLSHAGPVVLLEGDDLVLKNGARREVVPITPDGYTALKSISHIPLAVFSLLGGKGDAPADEERIKTIQKYRNLVAGAGKGLDGHGLSDAQLERQKKILDESVEFLTAVVDRKRLADDDLADYLRRMRPLLEADEVDAARGQIDALHRQMTAWKAKLTDDEWKRLSVVVMGNQAPRKDNLAVQYFARLLGEKGEGGRVVYSEGIWDESKALELTATREVDGRIGAAFFGDAGRMHRDLLGDAAKEYLDELFKQARP